MSALNTALVSILQTVDHVSITNRKDPGSFPEPNARAPKDHINIRILQHMISVSPIYCALEPGCQILVFMWSFGSLDTTPYARKGPNKLRFHP